MHTPSLTDAQARELRHTTAAALAAGLLVTGGLLVTFRLLLHPVLEESCNTSLLESPFKAALAPVHLAAAAILSTCVWLLSARRRGAPRPGRPKLWGLGGVWVYALASAVDHQLFGLAAIVGFFAAPTLGVLGLLWLATRAVRTQRSSAVRPARWQDHAHTTQILLWGGLLIGLPAHLTVAWMSGAQLFCF